MSILSDAKKMKTVAGKINEERKTPHQCVHKNLILRALTMLRTIYPEATEILEPNLKILVSFSKRPDRKGDYENGMGRHYYCASTVSGSSRSQVNGYYKNGIGNLHKSARAMFEEDHTMAVTMYRAGFEDRSAAFLGRAVHMLSDMCCLPHASSMTYYSRGASFHKAYERLAKAIYPERVPIYSHPDYPDIFRSKSSFADDINAIAEETAKGLADVQADPEKALVNHLMRTERILIAYLLRFYDDIHSSDRTAHYLTNNSGIRLFKGTDPLMVKITEKGIKFHGVNPSPESLINVTSRTFFAAHRHDGFFTLSPARNSSGKVLEVKDGKFSWHKFDPSRGEQLFKL